MHKTTDFVRWLSSSLDTTLAAIWVNFVHGILVAILCTSFINAQNFVFPLEDENEFYPLRVRKHDEFDWRLFQSISAENKGKNIVLSPFSIKLLMSILSEAAVANCKKQLGSVLQGVSPGPAVHGFYKNILKSISEKNDDCELSMGSQIYVDEVLNPAPNFVQLSNQLYNTNVSRVDFKKTIEVAEAINTWAAEMTNGHIKELVTPDNVNDCVAILTNAIYFNGKWAVPFTQQLSHPTDFRVSSEKSVKTPLMSIVGQEFYYLSSTELKASLLRMPYKGGKYVMTFILPDNPGKLDEVISRIKLGQIQYLQNQFEKKKVNVFIPKFKFETTSKLKDVISSLGISDIFTFRSNLPGLGGSYPISDVIQKAGVVIDEKGTELYAATDVKIDFKIGAEVFLANHPFAFFLEDEYTGALLFTGKVVDPTAEK